MVSAKAVKKPVYDEKYGRMLSDQEVADRLGWQKNTLQQRRTERLPVPSHVKTGLRVCVTPEKEVTRFIDNHLVKGWTK